MIIHPRFKLTFFKSVNIFLYGVTYPVSPHMINTCNFVLTYERLDFLWTCKVSIRPKTVFVTFDDHTFVYDLIDYSIAYKSSVSRCQHRYAGIFIDISDSQESAFFQNPHTFADAAVSIGDIC